MIPSSGSRRIWLFQPASTGAGRVLLGNVDPCLALVGRGRNTGILGSGFPGSFLALAGTLKHVPLMLQPGPNGRGMFSETLIPGLILSGLSLFGLSVYALWCTEGSGLKAVKDG
ncbi:MAG: hypothetical protein E4G99_13135 [Anaerolineales bacterium]|nr:MAG: hypothetical protein E4G99_13135 [Anaerolineales bacterium]